MTARLIAISLLAVAAAACADDVGTAPDIRAPAATVAGEASSCILTSRIRNTVVHDDHTIDFVLTGGEIYRNTLPNRCPGLGFEERFAYEANTGQLCQVDTITVLQAGAAGNGPRCGLGPFVPVRYAEAG